MSAVDLQAVVVGSVNSPPSVRLSDAVDRTASTVQAVARRLSPSELRVAWSLGAMVAALGLIGFVNSFSEVAEAVEPSFGKLSWSVPLGIDLGIAVFTGLDLFLARLGMRLSWLRLVPWSLVGVTVALNVAQPLGRGDLIGAGAHAVLPLLWVIAVEIAAHVLRWWAGLGVSGEERRAAGRMDRIRTSRWLLAPLSTLRIRRLMILWEERSYQAALDRWMARSRARGLMAKDYGRIKWRWKAPINRRLDYRYAQLTLATANPVATGPDDAPPTSSGRGSRSPGGASPCRPGTASKNQSPQERDITPLLPRGREIRSRLAAKGIRLNRETLASAWRENGEKLSNADAGPLVAALKEEGQTTVGREDRPGSSA